MANNKSIHITLAISLLLYLIPTHTAQDAPKKSNWLPSCLRPHQVAPQEKSQDEIEEEIRTAFTPIPKDILPLVLEYVENEIIDKQCITYQLPKKIDPKLKRKLRSGFLGIEEIIRIDATNSDLINILTTRARQLTITPTGKLQQETCVQLNGNLIKQPYLMFDFGLRLGPGYYLGCWIDKNYINNIAVSSNGRFKAIVMDETSRKRRRDGFYDQFMLFGRKPDLTINENHGVEPRKEITIYPSRREYLRMILLPEERANS